MNDDEMPSEAEIDIAYIGTLDVDSLTYGQFEALTEAQRDIVAALRSRNLGESCGDFCAVMTRADYGTADGLSDLLCKLWTWVVKVAKSVVDGVLSVLQSVISAAFDILDAIIESVVDGIDGLLGGGLGSWLLLGVGLVALYMVMGKGDKSNSAQPVVIRQQSTRQGGRALNG